MPVVAGIGFPLGLIEGVGVVGILVSAFIALAIVIGVLMGSLVGYHSMAAIGSMPMLIGIGGPGFFISMGVLGVEIFANLADTVVVLVHMGRQASLLAAVLTGSRMPVVFRIRLPNFFVEGVLAGFFIAAIVTLAVHILIDMGAGVCLQAAIGALLPVAGFVALVGIAPLVGVLRAGGRCGLILRTGAARKQRKYHHSTQRDTKDSLHNLYLRTGSD